MKKTNHRWSYDCRGVTPGSGQPHGVIEVWTCACGAQKARQPRNTHTGARVIRWSYRDADGNSCDTLPDCTRE